jgi:hypothetical protein
MSRVDFAQGKVLRNDRFSTPAPQPSEQPEKPVDATTEVLEKVIKN